jgi:cycloartenol synthase
MFLWCFFLICYCTLHILVGRMWCHCRMLYLPMCYIYGKRFVGRITPLVLELRKEIFNDPYNEIDWDKVRNICAKVC